MPRFKVGFVVIHTVCISRTFVEIGHETSFINRLPIKSKEGPFEWVTNIIGEHDVMSEAKKHFILRTEVKT